MIFSKSYISAFLFSPILYMAIFKIIIPWAWLVKNFENNLYFNVLLYSLILHSICFLLYFQKATSKRIDFKEKTKLKKTSSYNVLVICLLLMNIMMVLTNPKLVPILSGQGSDASMFIDEEHGAIAWFYFNLNTLTIFAIAILIANTEQSWQRYLWTLALILFAVSAGKKSSIMIIVFLLSMLVLVGSYRVRGIGAILIVSFSAVIYAIYILSKSFGIDFYTATLKLWYIIYFSGTIIYEQLLTDGGIQFANAYRHHVDNFTPFMYYFNPYLKILNLGGIELSIGPYIAQSMYGYTTSNGANPTLLFECLFIFGTEFGLIVFTIFSVLLWWLLTRITLKARLECNSLLTLHYFIMIYGLLQVFGDSLIFMRNLPFYLMPYLIYIVSKTKVRTY